MLPTVSHHQETSALLMPTAGGFQICNNTHDSTFTPPHSACVVCVVETSRLKQNPSLIRTMHMQAPNGKSGPGTSKGGASKGISSTASTPKGPTAQGPGCSQGGSQVTGASQATTTATTSARSVQRPRTQHPDLAFEVSEAFIPHLLFMSQ